MRFAKILAGIFFSSASISLSGVAVVTTAGRDLGFLLCIAASLLLIGLGCFSLLAVRKKARDDLAIGSLVTVRSFDGWMHLGRVEQIARGRYLVVFGSGLRCWVSAENASSRSSPSASS